MKANIYTTNIKKSQFMEMAPVEMISVDEAVKTYVLSRRPHILYAEAREKLMEAATLPIFPKFTYQEVIGIGGALTETSAAAYSMLDEEGKAALVEAYFDPEKGIGYSFGRCSLNSCDFSTRDYIYVEEGDETLESFSLKEEEKYVAPFLKDVLAKTEVSLFASPWSPPAFMKDTKRVIHGGKLLPEYYEVWADYVVKYILAYREKGVNITAVTIQNEPMASQMWESCVYTAEDEAALIKSGFGKKLQDIGVDIYIWDHNKNSAYNRAKVVYDDPDAGKYVKGVAVHWYSGDHFDQLDMLSREYPDKKIIFTEGCCGSWMGKDKEAVRMNSAEKYGRELLYFFKNGGNGFTDWNMILDENHGPFHHRDGDGLCDAPVFVDSKTKTFSMEPSYYYIGHFSKFVRPGAVRVGSSSFTADLENVAFKNPDGSVVMIILNRSERDHDATVVLEESVMKIKVEAHSVQTVVIKQ